KMLQVTRWRADSTLDQYGMFFYLRNIDTNSVWSATYSPMNVVPENYEVDFTADKAVFKRMDGNIGTKTEVIVASGDNAEIRRLSLKNYGDKPCTIEITSYFEVVMAPQAADLAHPAFSNLFIETSCIPERRCIVANRRPRSENDKSMWMANSVVTDAELTGDIQYETDRMQMLGRGRNAKDPVVIDRGKPLSNSVGPVLDPVMSIRAIVRVEPGRTVRISFLTAVAESNELLLSLVDKHSTPDSVEGAFRFASARSSVEMNYLNLDSEEIELYQNMLSHILFLSPVRRINQEMILQNIKGQSALWKYGISGDLPIALVVLNKTDKVDILYEVLKAHEYWRLMDLKVDLVIVSEEEFGYALPLYDMISDIVLSRQTHDILSKPKDVFILDRNKIPLDDVSLLYAVARIILKGDGRRMEEQIKASQEIQLPPLQQFISAPQPYPASAETEPELVYSNGLGGFSKDGGEYVIQLEKGQNTPAPWVNVIANPTFGFIASESGGGYAWFANSRENKLTPWSNDAVSDSQGEVLYISDRESGGIWTATALPVRDEGKYTIQHGFGCSVFGHTCGGIEQKLTQFVPLEGNVKISIATIKNLSTRKRKLKLTYYIRPVLGVSDQVTAMHIRTSVNGSGTLLLENPYNEEFTGEICFIDVSQVERTVTGDRKEFFGGGDAAAPECISRECLSGNTGAGFDPCGAMQIKLTLEPNESRDVVFLLGVGQNNEEVSRLTQKYKKPTEARDALAKVKKFWREKLEVVRVETPIGSMNLMLGGWLQYQVISCRLWARSGFYQSGGAYGFRDQLQDSLSVASIWPELTRSQILLHAKHQFTQGDVQHWWHEPMGKGTRTRISDDLLWLPYVTAEYIRITGDSKILEERLAFLEDAVLGEFEDERYGKPSVSEIASTLYDHCVRAIDYSMKFGVHGIPLMGSGDWNDGMNTVGNRGLGESVWLGWFLSTVLNMFVPVCRSVGDDERAQKYHETSAAITEAVEKNAWDGKWYRRAYFDNGQMLGSINNTECKIDSIAQTWSVISGAADPARSRQAMSSLEDYLVQRE
ncbi:MAG: glycosyl transferase, partial [Clostridiales bacterium]|nr:glycosyl transferase [Clostridiales bacterium]